MTAQRRCDGCTACCYAPAVPELGKPLNTWCTHCAVGTGCTIYKRRPQGCRDFECLWLINPTVPDELRPDRCGAVFEPGRHTRTCLVMVDPDRPTAADQPAVRGIINGLLADDVAVAVTCGDRDPYILAPEGVSGIDAGRRFRGELDGGG